MNFADTVAVHKNHHFGVKIIEIGSSFLRLSGKYEVLLGQPKTLKTPKTCLVRDVGKNDVISMTHKLRSEMSSQKIDTSADIRFESLTLLEGFVILDLNLCYYSLLSHCCNSNESSRKNLRTKVTPDLHLTYSKNGGILGLALKR